MVMPNLIMGGQKKSGKKMNGIYVYNYETLEKALRRFSKMCAKAGLLHEYKKTLHYEKPSEKRKRKKEMSKHKRMKEQRLKIK
jgi:small subunit ribosomal protein S21